MLPFKTNVRIFIIEFVCVVLLETVYAISMYGVKRAGLVSLGFVPTLLMFLIAVKVRQETAVIRALYMSAIFTFFFLNSLLHMQGMMAFMFLVVAVALALFIKPSIMMEYSIVTMVILLGMGIFQMDTIERYTDLRLFITYVMMYAFACVALFFISIGVQNYMTEMEEKNDIANEALEAKSNFLANMSHEIRTPMNAIYGMAELLSEKKFDKEENEYILTIKRSSENLLSIINEILDFSKVDSGKMTIDEEPYDFNSMLQDVITIIDFRMRSKSNIELITDIDPNIPRELIGDSLRVKQILINVLNNAVKFTNRGTITLQMTWDYTDYNQGCITIRVIDTGIGIAKENLQKLFVAFGQLDTKKNRNVEGTGLGLAITKKIVDLMGGSIEVQSVIKEGSTFTIKINQKVYDASPSNYAENCKGGTFSQDVFPIIFTAPSAKVLIVDDNAVNRQVASELLKLFGIEAITVENGQEAIDRIEKHLITYDLVFMDHMMPFMDGVEATRIIRNIGSEYAKNLPIIALTANAINGVSKQFLAAGMNDYLAKPIRIDQLNDILRRWIPDKKQYSVGTKIEDILKAEKENIDYSKMSPEEILEHLDGIDTEQGLKNCAGSVSMYFDLLQTYSTSNLANVLNEYFEKEDLANYSVTAHSIKGASRNIGAHDIADKAYGLERAGERGDINYIWDNHDELVEEYTAMLKMLKRIFFGQI